MVFSVEEGDFRFLDIKLYHDSFVLKQVILPLLKLITKKKKKKKTRVAWKRRGVGTAVPNIRKAGLLS